MKQRTITGILIAIFVAPFIIFGTYSMGIFVLLLALLGVYEFLYIKKKANMEKIPLYVVIISMIFSLLLIFDVSAISSFGYDFTNGILNEYGINILWLIVFLVSLLTCSIFDKKYSILDAIYTFSTILFLSLGLKGLLYLRSFGGVLNINHGALLIVYILITTCFTDIFAYFGGMTCYKLLGNEKVHKLNERISPKKTIEGTIVGTLFGTICGFLFSLFVLKKLDGFMVDKWYLLLLMSFVLSISGQIGDLILSAIKRYFNVKDYSNLLPGHGGVLDRIDSLLVNSMMAALFISLLS